MTVQLRVAPASAGRVRPVHPVEPGWATALRGVAVVALGAWLAAPFLPVLGWALAERWPYPEVVPSQWGIAGWVSSWMQGAGPAVVRSLGLGLLVAVLATPAGAAAGRALAGHRVPAERLVTTILFLPVAVPPFAVVMGLGTVALQTGVPATVAVVTVLVVSAVPYTTFVMRAAYAAYDTGYEDVARALGAHPREVLRRVHLPLISPALATAAFLGFLVGWSDYVVTLVLGGGRLITLPLLLASSAAGSGSASTLAALALLSLLPPTLLLVAVARLSGRKASP